ncbi:MAG TPA: hypothetical protein VOB72_12610 [Candidatus Dormibacteraeota bacterium]|nr:hypothetical protein [Candidatus Dormibacteraeota bacterium]
MHDELRELHEADQADRLAAEPPPDVIDRDRRRRGRVAELLDAGAAADGADFHHAAMVFQHGDELGDYWRAHQLALRAVELGYGPGRWLAAAAYDRWLMHQRRPQKYGTQYRGAGGAWVLYDVDPATTDAERAAWDVPSLAEARRRAERMTAEHPPGPGLTALEVCRHGGLELRIVDMESVRPGPGGQPAPEPLRDGDPVPWLPDGLVPRRLGPGFVAMREPGQPVVGWHRVSTPVLIAWTDQDGPPPEPEPVEIGGRPAIVCRGERGSWVLAGRAPERPWMVSGLLPDEDLQRVAASLP